MDAELAVALGFVCFVGLAFYLGAHSRIGATLDARGKRIADELAEAERMRKEAADILASFEGKRAQAEKEAAELVAQARSEAGLIAKEAESKLADFVKRRTAQAEAKIANAETQALAQVRASAADAAVAAAETVLRSNLQPSVADTLVTKSIGDLKRLTN